MSEKYDLEVSRDGNNWMISIPAINGLAQAQDYDQVEEVARSYIAADQGIALSQVELGAIQLHTSGHEQ